MFYKFGFCKEQQQSLWLYLIRIFVSYILYISAHFNSVVVQIFQRWGIYWLWWWYRFPPVYRFYEIYFNNIIVHITVKPFSFIYLCFYYQDILYNWNNTNSPPTEVTTVPINKVESKWQLSYDVSCSVLFEPLQLQTKHKDTT